MLNIEINNTLFLISNMEKIYDSYQDRSMTREIYLNMANQLVSKSFRNNRWADYKIEKYARILMKKEGCEEQILIESETDFFLLLRALLDKRREILYYPLLNFDTHEEEIQRFRLYQFLDMSLIQQADLTQDIIEIQEELVSLNSLKVYDIAQLFQLNDLLLFNLQSLSVMIKYLSNENISKMNQFLSKSSLVNFSLQIDFAEETEEFDEEFQETSIKLRINKNLKQLSLSSNCIDFFNLADLITFNNLEIFFQNEQLSDFHNYSSFKNINKIHFISQKPPKASTNILQEEMAQIILLNSHQLIELTINLSFLCCFILQRPNLEFPLLTKLTILDTQQDFIDEQALIQFFSAQKNLKCINIEMASSIMNQNILFILSKLYSSNSKQFSSNCFQQQINQSNKIKYSQKYLYYFHPDSIDLINEFQEQIYDSLLSISEIFKNIKEVTHLKYINLNLNTRVTILSPQDQEDIVTFVCKNKQVESIKLNFSQQNQNKNIYSILANNIHELTNLREGSFGFNFAQEFFSYNEFKEIMDKCLLLNKLVSLCWVLNGHGEDFEVFAIESLIDYHSITDLQIENHVKGAFCIEIFMDYINQIERQRQLWLKIQTIPIEQINYFFMKKRISNVACFDIAYEFSQNEYVQEFTTSTYDAKISQEETIDYYFYIFYSYRLSLTLYYKHIFSIMQLNPLYIIYDLFI